MLKLHWDVRPQPKKVAEYRRLIDMNWDRRFGRGGDWNDEAGDEDEEGDDDGD